MKIPIVLVIIFFLTITYSGYCQTVHYSYDASGNRTYRWVVVNDLKDPAADTTFKLGKEFWPTENVLVLTDVKVYPNPVARELNIEISNLGDATATARVCDVQGRPVLSVPRLTANNSLNLSELARGTYFLLVQCAEERRVWKLVKE